jgi:transglutaminase-like putative cysteine protease
MHRTLARGGGVGVDSRGHAASVPCRRDYTRWSRLRAHARPPRELRLKGRHVLDGLWVLLVLIVTLGGVWLSSSLAAYLNGPMWLAGGLGLLAFPVLPLAWEAWASARRARKASARPRFFTVTERVVLRTLALNLLVVSVLLARFPSVSFAALVTRGDWFLEGRAGAVPTALRVTLFHIAGGLEWLHGAAHRNPYDNYLTHTATGTATPVPAPVPIADGGTRPPDASSNDGSGELSASDFDFGRSGVTPAEQKGKAAEEPALRERLADGTPIWPMAAVLHPAVAGLPATVETGIVPVARYIAQHEPDPWLRVKALHDYVADRVTYDVESYLSGAYPPQDAETVFRTRRSVCAGYANLLAALGEAAGDEIVVVGGDARTTGNELTGEGHAWNAARIAGRWTLLDATWDAGFLKDGRFEKRYSTEFLFTPPEVQGLSHFPEEDRWQLRTPPLSRGEFLRQPRMRPLFYAEGFTLIAPDRPQVTVDSLLQASLRNPRRRFVLAHYERGEGGGRADCAVDQGESVAVRCDLPEEGRYRVVLFSNKEEYGTYQEIGEIEALRGKGR